MSQDLNENKNKEVEDILVLVENLEQIGNSLEFAANEVACIHQTESRRLAVAAEGVRKRM